MSKIIDFSLKKQKEGVDKAVNLIKITIGPRGKNVSLSNGDSVNDGKRIAEDLQSFKDFAENKGATKVRNLIRKISQDVGGGRTACAILYQNLIDAGTNLLEKGFNFNEVKKGMELAVKDITTELDKMSHKATKKELKQVATISTEREDLGEVIAETVHKIGKDGVVTVEESNTLGVAADVAEGLKYDRGWASPYMVTDSQRMEAEYKDVPVYITDRKLTSFGDLVPALELVSKAGGKTLFVIAEDFDESILRMCAIHKANGLFNILATKLPGVGDMKKFTTEDLAQLVGAKVVTEATFKDSFKNESVPTPMGPKTTRILQNGILGGANKVIAKEKSTIIIGGQGDLKTWVTTLRTRKELCDNKWEIDQYVERIAKLENGIAVIKVGATSDDEVKYLKLKVEDGVNETKRALEEGVVMGGNCAFIHALKKEQNFEANNETHLGYKIVLNAIEAPLRQIIENSNGSPDVVVNEILTSKSLTVGYNALDNTVVEDMYKEGIIDATKVVKSILTYAVAEASMFLSLGGDISELIEQNEK
jgi:chaperonin GroEL